MGDDNLTRYRSEEELIHSLLGPLTNDAVERESAAIAHEASIWLETIVLIGESAEERQRLNPSKK